MCFSNLRADFGAASVAIVSINCRSTWVLFFPVVNPLRRGR
jgi:hypothetical protein